MRPMYVNPFWLGFLIAIVVMLVLLIGIGMIGSRYEDEEDKEEGKDESV